MSVQLTDPGTITLEIPEAFGGLFDPYRYKAFYGGRGSAKSHSFVRALLTTTFMRPIRAICAREIQKSIADSIKQLIDDQIARNGLPGFRSTETYIEHVNGSLYTFAGLRSNPESIKSKEGYDIALVEEADRVSRRSLDLLIPTMRAENSELWFCWNPNSEFDAVDKMFRGKSTPPNSLIRRVSWRDNPFFPKVLKAEMEFDRATDPDKADHVWEGEYQKAAEGAYYRDQMRQARADGRLDAQLAVDPALPLRAYWDLGVSDYMSVWVCQFVGLQIRVLDHISGQGQPLPYYLNELRARGHQYAECVLPHDGDHRDITTAEPLIKHVKDAGFQARVIKNQGKGAAMRRVEATRRLFPRMHFDGTKCAAGLKAIAAYHERRDPDRNIGLGPEHDWASHDADSLGLMAVDYKEPSQSWGKPIKYENRGIT